MAINTPPENTPPGSTTAVDRSLLSDIKSMPIYFVIRSLLPIVADKTQPKSCFDLITRGEGNGEQLPWLQVVF